MAPKRGTRRSRNWRRIYPGYVFPGTVWTVVEGPYKRIKRSKVKSLVTARCGDCQQEFERRLDHLISGKSHRCIRCSLRFHQPWKHWEEKRNQRKESINGTLSLTASETNHEPEQDQGQEVDLTKWPIR
jgi:hypothetical protein